MDDYDEVEEYIRPSRRLSWKNVGAVVLSGVGGICEGISILLMADANYDDDRLAFHEEAALEIESLTTEE